MFRNVSTWWRHAKLWQRLAALFAGLVAAVAVMALVMGMIRAVQYQQLVTQAKQRQEQYSQRFRFDPGQIISDGNFFNAEAMTAAQVQNFLNEQGQECSGARCLKSLLVDTPDKRADALCKAYTGSRKQSAAMVIDAVAHACGISQRVLLTMLQKEQHLVSASQVSDFQIKSAMGLSCPDDDSCDPAYAGFFNQVYGAARRYKYYQAHESRYGYHVRRANWVRYHPNASCGGAYVYIENEATALLYIYTPYQPNEAALKADGGEGDACSSYGNRNFALIYRGWFGDPADSSTK